MLGSDVAPRSTGIALLADLEKAGALTPTHLDLSSVDMPYDRCEALAVMLGRMRDVTAWALADLLVYSEAMFGEAYAQIAEATGRSIHTLQNMSYVGANCRPRDRNGDVTFSHHAEVAKLEPAEQRSWLKRAADAGWSVSALRQELRDGGHRPVVTHPAWTEREQAEREREQQAVLAEVVEAADDPAGAERLPALAERARKALAVAVVPVIGKRTLTCPACGNSFEED